MTTDRTHHVDLDALESRPWPLPAEQRAQARQTASAADDADAYEVLAWNDATQRQPDSDITVLCWMADGEWFSGWWDDERGQWFDAATGGVLEVVTHWANPEGPL